MYIGTLSSSHADYTVTWVSLAIRLYYTLLLEDLDFQCSHRSGTNVPALTEKNIYFINSFLFSSVVV